ncbi:MAG TPA: hypothetical protein P5572_00450 [Phycisphaerae bacterium]|nr:hypothetical protein [Phycisphaerae bacterium]
MSLSRRLIVAILLITLAGCCAKRKAYDGSCVLPARYDSRLTFKAHISGLTAQEAANKLGTFGSFALVRVDGNALAIPLRLGEEVETDTAVRIEVERTLRLDRRKERAEDFTFVLGASPNPGVGVGEFSKTEGTFSIYDGWIFMWGDCPAARTKISSIAAEGTTIAVQIVEHANTRNRIFYVKKDTTKGVTVKTSLGTITLTDDGSFVDVKSDGSFAGPYKISDYPDAATFIADTSEVARAAGWKP